MKMGLHEQRLSDLGFTADQICEIKEGAEAGLDVSVYAKKEFYAIQMMQIRLGMLDKLPVELYAKQDYDWFQMEEIRKGLKAGLDVSIYAFPDLPYDKMRQVRKGLSEGIDLSKYTKLEAGVLRQLRKACGEHVNIIEYIKEGYETEQLEEIRRALKEGLPIKAYLSKELRGVSIREIGKGLKSGLDVAVYAKIDYCWQQMREIRLGLENRVDIDSYINPFYSWQQMREIRLGLEEGLETDSYSSLMYTAEDMRRMRLQLLAEENEKREAAVLEEESIINHFHIYISKDEMEAYLEIPSDISKVSRKEIEKALSGSSIKEGIDEEALDRLAAGEEWGRPVLVAKGSRPQTGKDGWYEYFFKTKEERKPGMMPDGSLDFQGMVWFEVVQQGQKIACYHPAEEGIAGKTVTGRTLNAKKGKEESMLTGQGFMIMPDKRTYLSTMTGKIDLKDNRLEVTHLLILDETTMAAGTVDFDGSIYVKGNLAGGTVIRATEDVAVDGSIGAATIEAGGNIFLRRGISAAGGLIKAGKSVISKCFEGVEVYAGKDIRANYSLNSVIYAERKIIITGAGGILAGGRAYAEKGLEAFHVGSQLGIITIIKAGSNEKLLGEQRETENKIKGVNRELRILGNAYLEMQRKYSPEERNTMEAYLKIENAIYSKEKQLEKLFKSRLKMAEKLESMEDVQVTVKGWLYKGVTIEINGQNIQPANLTGVTIKKVDNRIAVYVNQ